MTTARRAPERSACDHRTGIIHGWLFISTGMQTPGVAMGVIAAMTAMNSFLTIGRTNYFCWLNPLSDVTLSQRQRDQKDSDRTTTGHLSAGCAPLCGFPLTCPRKIAELSSGLSLQGSTAARGVLVERNQRQSVARTVPAWTPPGGPEELHLRAPTERSVTISRHSARLIQSVRNSTDAEHLERILARSPGLAATAQHIRSFAAMMTDPAGHQLDAWLIAVRADQIPRPAYLRQWSATRSRRCP
jgi:hypothetical protein